MFSLSLGSDLIAGHCLKMNSNIEGGPMTVFHRSPINPTLALLVLGIPCSAPASSAYTCHLTFLFSQRRTYHIVLKFIERTAQVARRYPHNKPAPRAWTVLNGPRSYDGKPTGPAEQSESLQTSQVQGVKVLGYSQYRGVDEAPGEPQTLRGLKKTRISLDPSKNHCQ